jgi:acyl carrier protein
LGPPDGKGAAGDAMSLPSGVMDFINENARRERVEDLKRDDDLFKKGVVDSFTLVDLISVLEEQCGIKVPDSDVNPQNFQTVEAIERYVAARRG